MGSEPLINAVFDMVTAITGASQDPTFSFRRGFIVLRPKMH